ncbi:hypothetical protein [Conyzicola nivalis]|uniref:hypothetical protein n=1 Tax=Conyzicola nivalis TaxID=1477021 RepID=UPI0033975D60
MGRISARARTGSAALALTLVVVTLVSLGFGATAASAAPLPPEITSPTEGSYVTPAELVTVTGVGATPGYGVEVLVDGGFGCSTESLDDGAWSCATEAGLAEGAHTVVARQTVDEELTGTLVNYTIGVAPEPPVEEPVDPPVVIPAEPPVEAPAETPVEAPAPPPVVEPVETPVAVPDAPVVPPAPSAAPLPAPAATPASAPATAPAVTPPSTLTPITIRAPLVWILTVDGITGPVRPGQSVTLSSSGLPAGSVVTAELHSTPIALGSTTVAADGTFLLTATIPLTVEAGDHHFVVAVTEPGEAASVTETAVTIDAVDETVAASAGPATTDATQAATSRALTGGGSPAVDRDEPGAPNSLTTSLAPAWEVLSSPVAIGSSVIAGFAFLLLVAFPSELLGSVIQRRYRLVHRAGRIIPPGVGAWFSRRPVLSGVGLIAVATGLTGFSDPRFGADAASARLLIACFLAALIVSYGTYALLGWFLNRRWSLPTSLNLRPFTLLITVAGIVLSRVLDFSPGFLFGLMLGLTFPAATPHALRSHARLLRSCLIVTMAVTSWFAYSGLVAVTGGAPTDFGTALLQDTLAALSTEGLTGMLVAMLPFLYLDGREIWQHSKRSWAATYAAIVLVFFLVVAPKPDSWADLGDKYGAWALGLGAYAGVALAVYYALHRSELRAAARMAAAVELQDA